MGMKSKVAQRSLWAQEDRSSGAGVLPISKDSGRALLNFRSGKVSVPHTFSVWGGFSDEEDRDPKQTAMRELVEESGYTGPINLVNSSESVFDDFVYVTFLGLVDNEFTPTLTTESADFRWVTYSELVALKPDLHPKFREFVGKEHELLSLYIA